MNALHKQFILHDETNAKALYSFLRNNWQALAKQGTPLSIVITEWKAKRSVEQNKRLWSLLRDIAANAWIDGKQFSAEAWHEMFKRKMIGLEETPDHGYVGISTTTLSVSEFSAYIDKIEAYAVTELGVQFHE